MTMLHTISHAASKIAELVNQQSEKSISVIVWTYKEGRQPKQDAIHFKNLFLQVEREFETMARNGSV